MPKIPPRKSVTPSETHLSTRLARLSEIFDRLTTVPAEWLRESKKSRERSGVDDLECVECSSYRDLVKAWRKAMRWTDGLDHALTVMLASITSTKAIGDQLWVKIIGPASCGKSTLCEAVSVNKDFVVAKSTIRGFHSGFGDGTEDNSLVARLYNKTLVTKDGDTLLQSPNLGQILSEARDLYDSTSRTHYRNRNSRDYSGVRMTWILCGTSSLRSIDSSELGERFLDCVIMEGIDDDLEDEILWRVANRADRNLSIEANKDASSHNDPDMVLAMQLTGGYIDYLRENASELLASTEIPEWAKRKCTRLGKFVAYMRARPSSRQDETAEREFAARLVSQHTRLAKCLAVVLNKSRVDEEVMERVTRVALDTGRGQTLELAKLLYKAGIEGTDIHPLAVYTGRTDDATRKLLYFLRQIGAVETFSPAKVKGLRKKPKWRLTERMRLLYEEVIGAEDSA